MLDLTVYDQNSGALDNPRCAYRQKRALSIGWLLEDMPPGAPQRSVNCDLLLDLVELCSREFVVWVTGIRMQPE